MAKHNVSKLLVVVGLGSALVLTGCQTAADHPFLTGAAVVGAGLVAHNYAKHHHKDHNDDNADRNSNLDGMNEQDASNRMERRGFYMVGGWQNDHGSHSSYTVWYNSSSGEGVQMKSVRGSIEDMHSVNNRHCS